VLYVACAAKTLNKKFNDNCSIIEVASHHHTLARQKSQYRNNFYIGLLAADSERQGSWHWQVALLAKKGKQKLRRFMDH